MSGGTTRLLLQVDREPSQWVPVEADEFVIGRSRSCDLVLGASQVSRRHCRISISNGAFRLEDLGSAGGTFYDGSKIKGAVSIEDGSTIRIGDSTLTCRVESADAREPPPESPQSRTIETPPPDTSTMSHHLWISAEPGHWIRMDKDEFVMGRAKSCDLRLPSPTVSRAHAAVRRTSRGFFIEDLGSTCGISRGDQTLETGLQPIHQTDEIGVGECIVLFEQRRPADGPPTDAGQISGLLDRNGRAHLIEAGRISIGTAEDHQVRIEARTPVSFVLGIGRRGGRWVGLLWNDSEPPETRRPIVVQDGEELTVGNSQLRLFLPRPLLGREAKTTETAVALRVSYVPDEWTYVDKEEFIIGRSRQNDLPVRCPTVSRHHCRVFTVKGEYFIEDLGSTSGVWFEGDLVHGPRKIDNLAQFRIGDQTLSFEFKP